MPAFLIGLMPILSQVLDRVLPDPEAKAKAMKEIMEQAANADLAQMAVNKTEAGHARIFVAGWRPFIGWIGGAIFAWHYLIKYMILTFASFFNDKLVTAVLNSAPLDDNFWTVIVGILGLGAMRSFEKSKGLTK